MNVGYDCEEHVLADIELIGKLLLKEQKGLATNAYFVNKVQCFYVGRNFLCLEIFFFLFVSQETGKNVNFILNHTFRNRSFSVVIFGPSHLRRLNNDVPASLKDIQYCDRKIHV
jgi:hypothetical protein